MTSVPCSRCKRAVQFIDCSYVIVTVKHATLFESVVGNARLLNSHQSNRAGFSCESFVVRGKMSCPVRFVSSARCPCKVFAVGNDEINQWRQLTRLLTYYGC